ncbi:thioesterase family protein [Neobacillus drentensis]|uniref:acyl-CoA thioesterase n=1 Tax=Neobacillus drentensis TaxID=220684 RepID=UPI003000CF1C
MAYSELNIVAETNRGHVNNVKLVDYLDEARKDWYHYCILLGVEAVVVHIGADFKKEVFNNEKLLVRTWLERVGNTSFTLKQTILNGREELVVSAEVILTTINRETRQKVSVPNEVRRLSQFDSILNFDHLTRENGIS